MYSCLFVDHQQISILTMCKIVRAIFYPHTFEIHIESSQCLKVHVQGASKDMIWQTALDFEIASLHVGYGFGTTVDQAEKDARIRLSERTRIRNESH